VKDNLERFETLFEKRISQSSDGLDPAHDVAHFRRVVATAKALTPLEGADPRIVIPAAWLHDLVNVPKNDPRRSQASRLSSQAAKEFLHEIGYATSFEDRAIDLDQIGHAIEAHSYSAAIEPTTIEARIVQDSDRLDGLGAIGIARVFAVAGLMGRSLYHELDPFAESREPDDLKFTVDHFYVKLFKTVDTLRTEAGRQEGKRRAQVMRDYLGHLRREIGE
jgi:uncharacterized protein